MRPPPPPPELEPPLLRVNVATTVASSPMVTAQLPMPLHAPPQPVNLLSDDAAAVSVIVRPGLKDAEQSEGQLMRARSELTLPDPLPPRVTVSVGSRANTAVIAALAVTPGLQAPHAVAPAHRFSQRTTCQPESANASIPTGPMSTGTLQLARHSTSTG